MEHKISKERWNKRKLGMILWMWAYPMLCFILMLSTDLSRLEPMWLFNMGADALGTLIAQLLFISVVKDRDDDRGTTMCLVWLIYVDSTQMFLDFLCWYVDGVAAWSHWNMLVNELFYIMAIVLQVIFWTYVAELIDPDDKRLHKMTRVVNGMGIIFFLFVLGNAKWHYYFYIDAAGLYHRASGYAFSLIFPLILAILSVILIFRAGFTPSRKRVLLTYITFPISAMIIQSLVFGISITYTMMLCSIVLMYTTIFTNRSDEMKSEQLRATQKENELLVMQKEHARLDAELDMATNIQKSMLPSIFPVFPGRNEFDVYASMDPAKEVGGDFYDIFEIDKNHICFVVADVSGKGVPAALFMMISKIMIKNIALASRDFDPGSILQLANRALMQDNETDMFVTVWLGIYEVDSRVLRFANAGHEELAVCHQGQYTYHKVKHGFVLGAMPVKKYNSYELQLEVGDRIFMYTDGVTEASNSERELFGMERLLESLDKHAKDNSENTLKHVREDIDDFVCGAEQFDDITMLIFEVKE